MKIILAADLKDGMVVHGKSGNRDEYAPLNWGLSPSAEPHSYIAVMKPKYLYRDRQTALARQNDIQDLCLSQPQP